VGVVVIVKVRSDAVDSNCRRQCHIVAGNRSRRWRPLHRYRLVRGIRTEFCLIHRCTYALMLGLTDDRDNCPQGQSVGSYGN